jgi:CO dehydrogenase maturation factor
MCEAHGHDHGDHTHTHGVMLAQHARPDDFRVVVTGKGGVGKTTLTALLALLLGRREFRVLALDADPQMNLPFALGLPLEEVRSLVPLSKNADYVEEKTGARPGAGWGLFFRLNPEVDDVVRRFGVTGPGGVRLLVMGNTVQPAAGCLCPENALLGAVVNAIGLRRDEAILMDTQAGFEHFGRALAKGFKHALVVTDPSFNGIQVALVAARLAAELDVDGVHLVVNGIRHPNEFGRAMDRIDTAGGFPFASIHSLPYQERLWQTEPSVAPLLDDPDSPLITALEGLLDTLVASETRVSSCAS